jgi:ABC-type Fe3+/spermidine/putrescine transport system ATPase subunit
MSNLDYKVRLELRHELRALQQRIGITAVYVTHDREEALTLSDRIAVIDAGRIVQTGAPEEIFHHPSSAFVAGFMGADNAVDLIATDDRLIAAAGANEHGRRVRAHFRSDSARIAPSGTETNGSDLASCRNRSTSARDTAIAFAPTAPKFGCTRPSASPRAQPPVWSCRAQLCCCSIEPDCFT